MPTLRFHGISRQLLKSIGPDLTTQLSVVVGCPRDWFHLEAIESTCIDHEGQEVCVDVAQRVGEEAHMVVVIMVLIRTVLSTRKFNSEKLNKI